MHDHVPVQCDRPPGTAEFRGEHPLRRRPLSGCGEGSGIRLRAEEHLESATGQARRVADHHDEVQRQGVVVPLVNGLPHLGGLEVQVPEVEGHRVGCHVGAVDPGHHVGHLRTQAQVP